jgi:hypothetical protein
MIITKVEAFFRCFLIEVRLLGPSRRRALGTLIRR